MSYNISQMAQISGLTTRTLRYYDNIGLLCPQRKEGSGYRYYNRDDVEKLQQIMLFREMGFELSSIITHLQSPSFNKTQALKEHLNELEKRKKQLDLLINNVRKSLRNEEGKKQMTDQEKFAGFKQQLVDKNEKKYGKEIRSKYGDSSMDESNRKILNMSRKDYEKMQALAVQINTLLEKAVSSGLMPESAEGRQIASLHKDWLKMTWDKYTKEAHLGLVQMYVQDERFKSYYDGQVSGCAQFLRDAVSNYLNP